MTRNVAVPRQVVWILEVTGTPTAGVLDHADSGLWGSKENQVTVTGSACTARYSAHVFCHKRRTSASQTISSPRRFTGSAGGKHRVDPRAGTSRSPADNVFRPTLLCFQNLAAALCGGLK